MTEVELAKGEELDLCIFSRSRVHVEVTNGARLRIFQPSPDRTVSVRRTAGVLDIGTPRDTTDIADITIAIPRELAPHVKILGWLKDNLTTFVGRPGYPIRTGSIIASGQILGDHVELVDEFIQMIGPGASLDLNRVSLDPDHKSEKLRLQADAGAAINVDFVEGTQGPFRVHGSSASKSIFVTNIDKWSLQRKEDPGSSAEQMGVIERSLTMPPLPSARGLSDGGIGR